MNEVKITELDSRGLLQLKDLDCFPLPIERDSIYIMFYRFFRNTCRLAYFNEELVGFILSVTDQTNIGHVYIHYLFVKENYRGNKIGERLLNEIIQYSRNEKFSKVSLMTSNPSNGRFYSKFGFILDSEIQEAHEIEPVIDYMLKEKKVIFYRLDL